MDTTTKDPVDNNASINQESVIKTLHQKPQTLLDKIQKLIDRHTSLKEKFETLKDDYERTLTCNIELEDANNQLSNDKIYLEQKVNQLNDQLSNCSSELNDLHEMNLKLEALTTNVATKIDEILNQCDMDCFEDV
jgi:chromosome segregation ATPase